MQCNNCKSEIDDGSKFCNSCGSAIVLVRKTEPEKPKSTAFKLFSSMTKGELFVGAMTLLSLMVQAILFVKSPINLEKSQYVYPIVCAVLAVIVYIKNKIFSFARIIRNSVIAFGISPLILWILMFLSCNTEYEYLFIVVAGIIPTLQIIAKNMLFFYLVILVWFFGYTIIKKLRKISK